MSIQLKLQDTPILQFISSDDAGLLTSFCKGIEKEKGDVIFERGKEQDGIYIIASGTAGVFTEKVSAPIATLVRGDAIGEMSIIEMTTSTVTIRALELTQLIFLDKNKLQKKLEQNPTLSAGFYKGVSVILSHRLKNTTSKISNQLGLGTTYKNLKTNDKTELKDIAKDLKIKAEILDNKSSHISKRAATLSGLLESYLKDNPLAMETFGDLNVLINDDIKHLSENISKIKEPIKLLSSVVEKTTRILESTKGM